jgi:hypothetical protein
MESLMAAPSIGVVAWSRYSCVNVASNDRLESALVAREISRFSYRKTKQNVALAFLFNGIGIPAAAAGLVYPVWAMVAMAISVSSIFINSMWGRPELFFNAILSVGRGVPGHGIGVPIEPDLGRQAP